VSGPGTTSKRVLYKVIEALINKKGRYRLLTKFGVLDHLILTKELNPVTLENAQDTKDYLKDIPRD
jgi:hypothetical protein